MWIISIKFIKLIICLYLNHIYWFVVNSIPAGIEELPDLRASKSRSRLASLPIWLDSLASLAAAAAAAAWSEGRPGVQVQWPGQTMSWGIVSPRAEALIEAYSAVVPRIPWSPTTSWPPGGTTKSNSPCYHHITYVPCVPSARFHRR